MVSIVYKSVRVVGLSILKYAGKNKAGFYLDDNAVLLKTGWSRKLN